MKKSLFLLALLVAAPCLAWAQVVIPGTGGPTPAVVAGNRTTVVPALCTGTDKVTGIATGGIVQCNTDVVGIGTSPLTTKGDLYGFSTADGRVPVGSNDQCFIADSTAAFGVKWGSCPGGVSRWDELTDPAAATAFLSNALAETLDFDFQAAFTAGTQVHFRQTTGNPTGGSFFGITVNDPDVIPFFISDGTNNVFQVERDADTTIRNFTDQQLTINLDTGDTADQSISLRFKQRGVLKANLLLGASGNFSIFDDTVERFLFASGSATTYRSGSTTTNHLFRDSAGLLRLTIHGDSDTISFGSASDVSVERTTHPNSVVGVSITPPTGRVFGMALFVGDPNTATWGATEKGVMWFNTTSNTWKGWDGAAVVTLTTSIGTWLSLSDTPGTFTAGAFYNVNTGATALELSPLSEDADSLNSSLDFEAPQVSTTGTAAGEYRVHEPTATGTDYVALGAPPSVATSIKFEVPGADGSANQVLKTDGSLVLGFTFVSSANLVAANKTISFTFDLDDPVDGDDGLRQHKVGFNITVVRLSCSTDTGSIGINVDERAEATPNTAGTNVLSASLVCDTNSQTSCASGCDVNTISNATIDADDPIGLILAVPTGSPTVVRVHVEATID